MKVKFEATIVQEVTIDVPDYATEREAFNAAHDIFIDDLHGTQSITNSIKVSRVSSWYGPLRPRFKVRCVGRGAYGPWRDCTGPMPDEVVRYFEERPQATEAFFREYEFARTEGTFPTEETKKQLDKILLSSDNG